MSQRAESGLAALKLDNRSNPEEAAVRGSLWERSHTPSTYSWGRALVRKNCAEDHGIFSKEVASETYLDDLPTQKQ